MKIRSFDSPTRFWITSSSDKDIDEYLVDIVEDVCTCKQFQCRCWPKRRDGASNASTRCKHLHFAREYFLDEILKAFKENGCE